MDSHQLIPLHCHPIPSFQLITSITQLPSIFSLPSPLATNLSIMSLTQTPSAVNPPVPTAQPTAILKQAEPRKTSTATQAHPTPGSLSRSYLDGQSPRGLGYTLTHTTPTGVPPMASSRVAALKRPIGALRGRGSGPGDTPMNSLSSLGKAAKPVPARLTSSDEDQAINQQPPNKIPSSYQWVQSLPLSRNIHADRPQTSIRCGLERGRVSFRPLIWTL
jgi:hypothetical protein